MHEGEAHVAPAVATGETVRAIPRSLDTSQNALPCKRLSSDSLLAGKNEIEIEHGTSIYRLRLTSLGKLILTK